MDNRGLRFNLSLFGGVVPHFTPYDINNTEDLGGMTPLHWLCVKQLYCHQSQESDNLDTIKWLLSQGAKCDTTTNTLGYTPLHILSLGRESEELEVSNVWTLIKENYGKQTIEKNEKLSIKNAVRILLESCARIIRNRTHNLTPLSLLMIRLEREEMKIQNVLDIFPVDLSLRDIFELLTIKLCKFRNLAQLLKIVSLSVKHGCRYLGNADWNVSEITQLMEYKSDLFILVYTNEIFKGKLLPDYIPLVLPLEGQNMNEIFPLREMDLLFEVREVLSVYDTFGVCGVVGALNLRICEESMYISFEDLLSIFSEIILELTSKYCLKKFEIIFDNFVDISVERFKIKPNSSSLNILGAACLLILLEFLNRRSQDRTIAKGIMRSLIGKYEMGFILHRIIEMMSGSTSSYKVAEGERSKKLIEFEWKNKLEIIFEFLEVQINSLDKGVNTCLHLAINCLDTQLITELLSHNAYPYARNRNGDNCIDLIMENIINKSDENSNLIFRKKISILHSAPRMLKVLTAELITQCGLWISEDSLPVSARNILILHGYKF